MVAYQLLQWGRDRAVPEINDRPEGDRFARGASMGPGPRGPGNFNVQITDTSLGQLQWGRDRAVPEMMDPNYNVTDLRRASMGPGPRGPGNTHCVKADVRMM